MALDYVAWLDFVFPAHAGMLSATLRLDGTGLLAERLRLEVPQWRDLGRRVGFCWIEWAKDFLRPLRTVLLVRKSSTDLRQVFC